MPAGSKATVPASKGLPRGDEGAAQGARGKVDTQQLCAGEGGREASPRMGVWGPVAGPGSGKAQAQPR